MADQQIHVVNNPEDQRFEAQVDDQLAVAEYRLEPGRIIFTHTEVPKALEGRGIAGQLARAALNYARDQQLEVVPRCSYIAAYIRRHPEYQSLVHSGA